MGISIMQWGIPVGVHFYCKAPILRAQFVFDSSYHIFLFVLNCAFQMFLGSGFTILYMFRKSLKNVRYYFNHTGFWYLFFNSIPLLILCGDVDQIPGPKDTKYLSLCHWNLNSLAVHDFAKVSALKAFNATEKFDVISLSKSYLDSTSSSDDRSLSLDGYNLIRADHPKNIKQGGVCIYHRGTLPVKTVQINYLPECLVC